MLPTYSWLRRVARIQHVAWLWGGLIQRLGWTCHMENPRHIGLVKEVRRVHPRA